MSFAEGRVAFVSGGAGGIGLAVAERLLQVGASVAIGDVSQAALKAASQQLGERRVLPIEMDVTTPTSVGAGIQRVVDEYGKLDTLVNSAGVFDLRPFTQITAEKWDWMQAVNLKGVFLTCQASIPHLVKSGRGRIVNVASGAGKRGAAHIAHYAASKFGVIGLTQSLAVEYARLGMTVNAVCPGALPNTAIGQKVVQQKMELSGEDAETILRARAEGIPVGRLSTVADVADAVMFFISDNASYVTGESMNIDGGALFG
jgi:meso-butanediol dehydrogenase/(S,S)-butanediol dehydrogenase/diacetyl reductase